LAATAAAELMLKLLKSLLPATRAALKSFVSSNTMAAAAAAAAAAAVAVML